jgi:tRNA threonylcarbamoyl adenosine modification protein (Sua5/YciO/YrdC/YwlC family)
VSEHLYTYINPPNERHLEKIVTILNQDGVIALPCGTNWAFCCDPTSKKAQERIKRLKPSRPDAQPFSIICTNIAMASTLTKIGHKSYRLLRQIWPGPFTVILQSGPQFPKRLKNKRETVGVRIPNEVITTELIQYYGKPLLATSIPLSSLGHPFKMGYEVYEHFGHQIDLIVDIGNELPGTETTIFDVTGSEIELIRVGAGNPELVRI